MLIKNTCYYLIIIPLVLGFFLFDGNTVHAAPGTFRGGAGQAFCGYLQGGASSGGACDTSIHTGNYRGAGLGQNLCRILVCTF